MDSTYVSYTCLGQTEFCFVPLRCTKVKRPTPDPPRDPPPPPPHFPNPPYHWRQDLHEKSALAYVWRVLSVRTPYGQSMKIHAKESENVPFYSSFCAKRRRIHIRLATRKEQIVIGKRTFLL